MKTNKILVSAFALSIAFASLTSCSSDSDSSLPPIGGYNNADEVGAANLKAYWPLDGNGKESISNTSPSTVVGTTWETGVKGQSAKLAEGYLKYPSMTALSNSLTSFSVSAWIKVKNNGSTASVFFSLSRPNEWAGNVNFMAETGWKDATVDSLTVKGLIVSNNSIGWQDSRNAIKMDQGMIDFNEANPTATQHVAYANKVGGQWAHAVITWDGQTRLFKVYTNGVKISNPAWEKRGDSNGDLLTFTTPTAAIIGAFGDIETTTETWNKAMTGNLDEIRVWDKALSQSEIGSLYELEKAGR